MFTPSNPMYPEPVLESHLYFETPQIEGLWQSREGSPAVRIYRNERRRGGGYWIAFSYNPQTVVHRPLKHCWGLCYCDLYGRIGIAYDSIRDVLSLVGYGDYYRVED